jgi:hypothetical protein
LKISNKIFQISDINFQISKNTNFKMLCNRFIAKHFVFILYCKTMLLIKYRFVKDAFQLPNHQWIEGVDIASNDTLLEIDHFASSAYLATAIEAIKRADAYQLYICEETSEYNVESFGSFVNKLYKLPKPTLILNKSSNPMVEKWIVPLR